MRGKRDDSVRGQYRDHPPAGSSPKFDKQEFLEEAIRPHTPEERQAARVNAAESAIAGEWEKDELRDVLSMLGLEDPEEGGP